MFLLGASMILVYKIIHHIVTISRVINEISNQNTRNKVGNANILADGSTEYNSGDTLKKMNPFPSLISLTPHIIQFVHFSTFLVLSNWAGEKPISFY
jgi:FlaG/FlaF family flagellin (archaellin)